MSEHKRGRLAQGIEGAPIEAANAAPRCGAMTRAGTPCERPALQGRTRCALHGGKSTGPRTAEGLERSRRANWKHGLYSAEARTERKRARQSIRRGRVLLAIVGGKEPSPADLNALTAAEWAVLRGLDNEAMKRASEANANPTRFTRRRPSGAIPSWKH